MKPLIGENEVWKIGDRGEEEKGVEGCRWILGGE